MGCGLSKPQGISRNSHARLEELHRSASATARDTFALDAPRARRSSRSKHRRMSSGNDKTPAESSKTSPRKEVKGQPAQAVGAAPTKGESTGHSGTEGTETKPRRRRGGKKVARRRENRRIREKEEALRKQVEENSRTTQLEGIPEQRGYMLGQRVDRASLINQPWRKSAHEQAIEGRAFQIQYSGTGEHTVEPVGRPTRISGLSGVPVDERQVPNQAVDVSVVGNVGRRPISAKPTEIDLPRKIPTEPKKDRLARERREAAASRSATVACLRDSLHGPGNAPKDKISRLPDYKFGDDDWSLEESVIGLDSKVRKDDDREHSGSGTAKHEPVASKPSQRETPVDASSVTPSHQSSQIDWTSIRERMESKLGKPSSAAPAIESTQAASNNETQEEVEAPEPQKPVVTSKDNSPGWSFDKVL